MSDTLFMISAFKEEQFPVHTLGEISFAGRSNCGKSSLINSLFNIKGLAKTSSQPGKTVSINFFNHENLFIISDLPGYGYAKVPKSMLDEWKILIENYLEGRQQLKYVLILSDIRRGLEEEERDLATWLSERGISFILVFTKIDKLSGNEYRNKKQKLIAELNRQYLVPSGIFFVSGLKRKGIEELKDFIKSNLCRVENDK
jgi:GTP-binding protein